MNKLGKTLCAAAIAGAMAAPFSTAHAWGGWGPWGGGGPWGGDNWGSDWGPFDGDGWGDMDFSMSGGGRGSGYCRGYAIAMGCR